MMENELTPENHVESYRSLDKQQFSRVAPLLRPDSKVLEIGCSYGGVLKEVVRFGVDVCHAVEPNKEDARFVKSSIPEVNLIEDLFLDADFPESYYDVIIEFSSYGTCSFAKTFSGKDTCLAQTRGISSY